MTTEKFTTEVQTLKKFFELYCRDKHQNLISYQKTLSYNDTKIDVELHLCKECNKLIEYSFERLHECPHDPKPRCRTCPKPCYEKPKWKQVARLMRYSGMKLGLSKVRKIFQGVLKKS